MYQKLRKRRMNAFALARNVASATTKNAPTNVAGDGNVQTNASATIDVDMAFQATKCSRSRGADCRIVTVFAPASREAMSAIEIAIARNAKGRFREIATATIATAIGGSSAMVSCASATAASGSE